jgi:pyruvate dehydrogenase E1 component alpha subunit
MAEAIENARSGNGATVIEMVTYRLSDHTTADDATRYRPGDEVDAAWEREPLIRLREYLSREGGWNEEKEAALQAECAEQVEQAVQVYLDTDKPDLESMFDYMYANMPHDLAAQKERALEELK